MKIKPTSKKINKKPLAKTERDKAWVEGMWYAIERCVDCNYEDLAIHIIVTSNIPEWEFRQTLKETNYMKKELTDLLNKIFKNGK